jgi:hypothetical protein
MTHVKKKFVTRSPQKTRLLGLQRAAKGLAEEAFAGFCGLAQPESAFFNDFSGRA